MTDPKPKPIKKLVTFPPELLAELQEEAQRIGSTVPNAVRMAIRAWLDAQQAHKV